MVLLEGQAMDTAVDTPLVSVDEAAAILRVNRKTLLAWFRKDYGPTRRLLGNRSWYLAEDLDAFIHSRLPDGVPDD